MKTSRTRYFTALLAGDKADQTKAHDEIRDALKGDVTVEAAADKLNISRRALFRILAAHPEIRK